MNDFGKQVEFEAIRRNLLLLTGFDIGNYKPPQMLRLLSTIMARSGAKDFPSYVDLLRQNPSEVQRFKNCMTINVSEFFRDASLFRYLDETILPHLLQRSTTLNVWSAGCAGGEEPYSLAILLEEKAGKQKVTYRILATDIDEEAMSIAKLGFYTERSIKNVSSELLELYFDKTKNDYQVKKNLKARIAFGPHNLLLPMTKGMTFQLILCRNVVIYFSDEAKLKVYRNLVEALEPEGILFVGATENLLNYRDLGLEKIETYFYRKPSVKRNP